MSEETKTSEATSVEEEAPSREMSANELLAKDREQAGQAIFEILQKYSCDLTAEITVGQNKIVPKVLIVNTTAEDAEK